jgi:hypothetical protein
VVCVAGSEKTGGGGPSWDALRAGNAEREQVVRRLNKAFSEGRLDVAELEERVAQAYAAKTLGDLRPLTADLPPEVGRDAVAPVPPAPPLSRPATVQDLKQVALDLAASRLNAKLERDRERTARRQQRYERQQRRDLARQTAGSHPVAVWATVSLVCFVIWLVTAVTRGGADPWFLWVAGPWGAVLLGRYLGTHGRRPSS